MGIASTAGWAGRKIARRSQWLAKRLWIISLVEVALLARSHWVRLEPAERQRLTELTKISRGRPSQLSGSEQRELEELLEKLGHLELARNAFARMLPIGGSIVRRIPIPERLRGRAPKAPAESEPAERPKVPV